MKKEILIATIIFLLTLFVFNDFSSTFYQQDEWHTLGLIKAKGFSYLTTETSLTELFTLENRPLARLANIIFLGKFPLNIFPIFLFAIFFHSLNSFLVYKIVNFFVKKWQVVFLATLFFTFNSVGKQAVLWFGTVTSSLPSAFGVLASILFYLYYLENKKHKYFLVSIFFFIFSLFFKETGLFLLVLFPVIEIFYTFSKKKKIKIQKLSFVFLSIAIIFFLFKFLTTFLLAESSSRYVTSSDSGTTLRLLWAAITYPLESLSQITISGEILFPFSRRITEVAFPYFESTGYAGLVSEIVVLELISILASLFIIVGVVIYFLLKKNKWPIVFSALFYLFSFIPYIVLKKPNGFLESRYYYLAVAPIALFLGILINEFQIYVFSKKKVLFLGIQWVFMGIYAFYLFKHISFINDQIEFLKERSIAQQHILSEIVKLYPRISNPQVFYIESDHDFIVPNNPLPFQNGIGYTLLTVYAYKNDTNKLDPFLTDNYFWKLGNQGYLNKNGQGFGFFTDIKELKKEIVNKKINPNSVVSFRYNSEKNTVDNITSEIKKQLD